MDFKADLHCHSTCSDGLLTPIELLEKAKSCGLSGLSITDHDTVQAYTKETIDKAESLGLILCTGVEFSCQLDGFNVHVLGYNLDVENSGLQKLCQRHQNRRKDRNRKILKKLRTQGILIEEEELEEYKQAGVIGRPHIASLMIKKGFVLSIKEAFNRYIGDGKCCFDPGESFSIDETINVIHRAGGTAFIAHPHLVRRSKTLRDILKKPFDGLECYYGIFQRSENQKWLDIAKEKNWLISGGSDFHGDLKPQIYLGSSWVDEPTLLKILQK